MKYRLGGLLIGILATVAAPAAASPDEAHQVSAWRSQLRQAMCSQSWSQAIGVSGALVGSAIQPSERIWLLALRQDLFAYQTGAVPFSGCEGNVMMAGATRESVSLLATQSALDWEGTLARMGLSSAPDSAANSDTMAIAASATQLGSDPLTAGDNPGQLAYAACQPVSAGDFRVASGAVSNRWVYEIWQNIDTFYLQYWRQSQTCTQAVTTGSFTTQQAARQYMFDLHSNESVGNIP